MSVANCVIPPIGDSKNIMELNKYYFFKHICNITYINRDKNGNMLEDAINNEDIMNDSIKKEMNNRYEYLINDTLNKDCVKNNKKVSIEFFKVPDQNINLFDDLDNYIYKTEELSIQDIINKLNSIEYNLKNIDFVCFSKTLIRLMEIPYIKQKWRLKINKSGNTIYMYDDDKSEMTNDQKKICYSNNKFKHLCKENPTGNEYNILTHTKFNNYNMILCSNVDCILKDGKYIIAKTTKELANEKLEKNFVKYKLIKYWLSAKLSNIDSTILAFRDNEGNIKGIATLRTNCIGDFVEKPYIWSSKVCFNICDQILEMLKTYINEWVNYYLIFEPPYTHVKLIIDE